MTGPHPRPGPHGAVDPPGTSRRAVEDSLARLLGQGVCVSSTLVALGLIASLLTSGGASLAPAHLSAGPVPHPGGLAGAISRALAGPDHGLIVVGILVLILTPIARVVAAAVLFGREGDRLYTGLTLAVLAVLVAGILGSR